MEKSEISEISSLFNIKNILILACFIIILIYNILSIQINLFIKDRVLKNQQSTYKIIVNTYLLRKKELSIYSYFVFLLLEVLYKTYILFILDENQEIINFILYILYIILLISVYYSKKTIRNEIVNGINSSIYKYLKSQENYFMNTLNDSNFLRISSIRIRTPLITSNSLNKKFKYHLMFYIMNIFILLNDFYLNNTINQSLFVFLILKTICIINIIVIINYFTNTNSDFSLYDNDIELSNMNMNKSIGKSNLSKSNQKKKFNLFLDDESKQNSNKTSLVKECGLRNKNNYDTLKTNNLQKDSFEDFTLIKNSKLDYQIYKMNNIFDSPNEKNSDVILRKNDIIDDFYFKNDDENEEKEEKNENFEKNNISVNSSPSKINELCLKSFKEEEKENEKGFINQTINLIKKSNNKLKGLIKGSFSFNNFIPLTSPKFGKPKEELLSQKDMLTLQKDEWSLMRNTQSKNKLILDNILIKINPNPILNFNVNYHFNPLFEYPYRQITHLISSKSSISNIDYFDSFHEEELSINQIFVVIYLTYSLNNQKISKKLRKSLVDIYKLEEEVFKILVQKKTSLLNFYEDNENNDLSDYDYNNDNDNDNDNNNDSDNNNDYDNDYKVNVDNRNNPRLTNKINDNNQLQIETNEKHIENFRISPLLKLKKEKLKKYHSSISFKIKQNSINQELENYLSGISFLYHQINNHTYDNIYNDFNQILNQKYSYINENYFLLKNDYFLFFNIKELSPIYLNFNPSLLPLYFLNIHEFFDSLSSKHELFYEKPISYFFGI